MNLLNFKTVKRFIDFTVFCFSFFVHVQVKAWEVDFSRRQTELKSLRVPASISDVEKKLDNQNSESTTSAKDLITNFMDVAGPTQDLVILNTANGFVPETIRLKKGGSYRIHVVNVNEKEKNVSFIMDSFSEHHATFFGQQKTFSLQPKTDGIFSYQCPETAKQGRVVIYSGEEDGERMPASSSNK